MQITNLALIDLGWTDSYVRTDLYRYVWLLISFLLLLDMGLQAT
jgi:hypothetical protein